MIYFKDDYITGYSAPTEKEWSAVKDLKLVDELCQLTYKWPDYPEGEPVYSPQPYTPEQLEQLRKEWCQQEIRKLYSIDDEAKIQRKMLLGYTDQFKEYNTAIEAILTKSKEKDFQIDKNGIE